MFYIDEFTILPVLSKCVLTDVGIKEYEEHFVELNKFEDKFIVLVVRKQFLEFWHQSWFFGPENGKNQVLHRSDPISIATGALVNLLHHVRNSSHIKCHVTRTIYTLILPRLLHLGQYTVPPRTDCMLSTSSSGSRITGWKQSGVTFW